MELVKENIIITGMTCTGCENRIENTLRKLPGIVKIKVKYSDGTVFVEYDKAKISFDKIAETIKKSGYEIASHNIKNGFVNKENLDFFITAFVVIYIGYMMLRHFSGFNFLPEINSTMTLGMLFIAGLLTSFHCVAMCGGINISQCTAHGGKSALPSFLYNSGRVVSYTILGGIVGAAGSIFNFSNTAKAGIMIAAGAFMVLMGLKLADLFPALRKVNMRIPFLRHNSGKSSSNPFVVGIMNGFMPCGPLQAMQLYALGTGSFVTGALSMFVFSLGTVPLMFGLGFFSSLINRKNSRKVMIASGVIVLFLGSIMVTRGMGLAGINIGGTAVNGSSAAAVVANGKQTVTTNLNTGGYTPITVQKGVPVKWTIEAGEEYINGCNKSLVIPEYKIKKDLVPGKNIIEFTPDKSGVFGYSCWMGMIRSSISVVDNIKDGAKAGGVIPEKSSQPEPAGKIQSGGFNSYSGLFSENDVYIAKPKNGLQEAEITVDRNGYSPKLIVFQKGIKGKIKFKPKELNTCNNVVVFPEYDGSLYLKKGELETPELIITESFTFSCWMGMLNGQVKVVDDVSKINKKEIISKEF